MLYDENGYVAQDWIIEHCQPYTFEIGGRGIGKTFGALRYLLRRPRENKFLYLRRTQTEADDCMTPASNPFKKLMIRYPEEFDVKIKKFGDHLGIIIDQMTGEDIGYIAGLSTFAKVRGADFSDVDFILYDEFVPEKQQHIDGEEYKLLLNLLETVGRNRELEGQEPVRLLAMSNANDIANPYFIGMEIVNRIGAMMQSGQERYIDPAKAREVIFFRRSKISEAKKKTALYRFAGTDSEFAVMSLENMFSLDTRCIKSRNIREYIPQVRVGELVIYRHKSRSEYYVNCRRSGTPEDVYLGCDKDLDRFRMKYMYIFVRYMMHDNVIFEDASSMVLFERLFK